RTGARSSTGGRRGSGERVSRRGRRVLGRGRAWPPGASLGSGAADPAQDPALEAERHGLRLPAAPVLGAVDERAVRGPFVGGAEDTLDVGGGGLPEAHLLERASTDGGSGRTSLGLPAAGGEDGHESKNRCEATRRQPTLEPSPPTESVNPASGRVLRRLRALAAPLARLLAAPLLHPLAPALAPPTQLAPSFGRHAGHV